MDDKKIRPGVALGVAAALLTIAALIAMLESRRAGDGSMIAALPPTEPVAEPVAKSSPASSETERGERPMPASPAEARVPRAATPRAAVEPPPEEVPYIEGLVYGEIDLREARAVMPDNLYWQWGAPTKDEAVIAARDEERRRRNEEYGRVLSGDASEDEVRAYYDYRTELSTDYFEFAEFMHRRHKDHPSDEFVGMLELAIKMHTARLAELPKEREAALERSRAAAVAREEWRRQQEEFGER